MLLMQRLHYIVTFIALLLTFNSFATHNRAGEITYIHVSGNTYEVTITTYTKTSSTDADRDQLTLLWRTSNNSSFTDSITIPRFNGNGDIQPGDIKINKYVGRITLSSLGVYIFSFLDPNRISSIININGGSSVEIPFYVEDTLFFRNPNKFDFNSSVQLLSPPIDFANIGIPFIHNPNAFDPDGDSLTFELIPPLQSSGFDVPNYVFPNQVEPGPENLIEINSQTGVLTWDAPQREGTYNVAILIREYRFGAVIGTVIRDFQIIVRLSDNLPPVIDAPDEICAVIDETISFNVEARDPNSGDVIQTFVAQGQPLEIINPASFSITPANPSNPMNGAFSWSTNCNHINKDPYQIVIRAIDNGEPILTGIKNISIKLFAPPPLNVEAIYDRFENDVTISWDSLYSCSNNSLFQGFHIWRKIGCNDDIDTCNASPQSLGYQLVGQTQNYSFVETELERGNEYSYRVTAHFALENEFGELFNPFEGFISEEACIDLPLDLPLFYNVDVQRTDSLNGKIYVEWTLPDTNVIDSIPGPYTIQLNRADRINGSSFTTLKTYSANTLLELTQLDTTFCDSLINTVSQGYNYSLIFTGNSDDSLGATFASSVFLDITADDETLILSWEYNTPWINDTFIVFRLDTITQSFDSIGLSTTNSFSDTGLINEVTYCYFIRSIGGYTKEELKYPLINNSQEKCAFPIDTIPPCPPVLQVRNLCDDETLPQDEFVNYLTWSFDNACEQDDAVKFYIYYSSENDISSLNLIDSTDDATTFNYEHDLIDQLAGCYAVTAIDEAGNESTIDNIECTRNCIDYELPTAFTPNGDGENDIYTPILPFRFVGEVDMKIFNRWGNLVFETTDPNINWDGRDINSGKELNSAVYFYTCELYEETVDGFVKLPDVLNGFIHLFRD